MIPRVSVVIPTYNRAEKVGNAVDSVLGQTFSDLEVIVVDDGSSDGTGKMLQATYGDRIRYYYQANQGVSSARNRGMAEVRGQWIAFLDSDDLWEKDKLEWQLKALEQFPECGACYTDARLFNHPETRTLFKMAEDNYLHEETLGINTEVLRLLLRPGGGGMVLSACSLLASTDVVRRTGELNPQLRFHQDTEFMFRLATRTEFCYVNRPLARFDRSPGETRHVGESTEWDKLEFILKDSQICLEGLLRESERVPSKIRKLIRTELGFVHSGLANCYLETGDYVKARQAISQAMQLNLTFNIAMKWLLTRLSPDSVLRATRWRMERRKPSIII